MHCRLRGQTGPRVAHEVRRRRRPPADGDARPEKTRDRPDGITRREADKALQARLVAIREKRWRVASPLTFEQYARTWLDQGETRRDWKPRTLKAYRTVVDRLCDELGTKR